MCDARTSRLALIKRYCNCNQLFFSETIKCNLGKALTSQCTAATPTKEQHTSEAELCKSKNTNMDTQKQALEIQ